MLAVDYLSLSSDVRSTRLLVPDHVGIVEGRTYLWAREWTPASIVVSCRGPSRPAAKSTVAVIRSRLTSTSDPG
ncbi:hypothetical protein ACUY2Q_03250 [Corynebacterium bovis]